MPEAKDKIKILSDNLFPVVGIGASAGGLDAFKRLLKAIPEDSGMAYILVQHLDPAHESILSDLLQRVTKIPVHEITDNIKVEPDHIYIIPSNKLLTATDGILELSFRPSNKRNMPIDVLFISLAEVHQNHAIGVVLSGTGTDGTLGLKAIKEHGGIAFVQQQQSASYDAMPQSAVDAGVADFILAPEKMPAQLLALKNRLKAADDTEQGKNYLQKNEFKQIYALLRSRKGVDFTYYKQTTIQRRISRRIVLSMKENLSDYFVHVKENSTELDILYQDLLIPVTQFFRDPKFFEYLCESVFPALLNAKPSSEPLRIWVAGCSTGEEAYSIVMCLNEYLGDKVSAQKIQVFATDISDIAITKARSGIYKKSELIGVSEARLQQFFVKTDDKFCINKSIRDCGVFAYHNYLKDPPFAKIDLISCRNSLIYLEPFLQKNALTTFHYALNEKGFLLLGKSETTGPASELFNIVDKTNKIYTRKGLRGKFLHVIAERKEEIFKNLSNGLGKNENIKDDFQKAADDVLLNKFAPPGVVVNNELDIVQFRGTIGMWLEPSPGKPNFNVVKMAREGLSFELRNALHKAQKTKEPVIKEEIPIKFMGTERLVTIEVIPLLNTIELHFLILFRDISFSPEILDKESKKVNTSTAAAKQNSRNKLRAEKLEKELALAREDMRGITEDQEATNEELQSANEELLSGSEELQSLNEELETSKEEIQTSNEELIVVNQELYERNEQLNLSRLYAESVVTTIREPLVVLNKDLKVRSANKAYCNKFQTSEEETVGKSFLELGNKRWDIPGLKETLEKINSEKTSVVDFEIPQTFPQLGERIMRLNASRIIRDNNEEQSILLAIEDITEERQTEVKQKLFSDELEKKVIERTSELQDAIRDLEYSNSDLQQFAYIASHDLQEPLRKIRTFASMLQDRHNKDLAGEAKELVDKISSSSERMSLLIRDVLNFSRIIHGNGVVEKTDLNDVLHKIRDDFDLIISEKKAVIICEKLPVIEAIYSQMDMLFCNLISNALKFSKTDIAPLITITSRILPVEEVGKNEALNRDLSYYEINFQDNGVGFGQEYAEQIFLIFTRLHGSEKYAGTGIGLAACKKVVLNHQGDICAKSNEGEGSLFQVILPSFHR